MAELGQTQDPAELVPGKPEAIEDNVRVLRARADRAGRASEGLKAIDTGAWTGPAAHAFHDKFSYEPAKWYDAADSMLSAADALDHYAGTLRWAQAQATEALAAWNQAQAATQRAQAQHDQAAAQAAATGGPALGFTDPGAAPRQTAQDTLNRARAQLAEVGDTVAGAISDATSGAPQDSSWLDDAGNFLADAGGHLINGLASLGNTIINHPGDALTAAAGIGLTVISSAGEGLGVALDATGVGAVAGVPLNVVSAVGIAAGASITGVAVVNMAGHAAGDDHVSPADTNHGSSNAGAESEPPFPAPKEITGKTAHGEDQMATRNGHGVNDAAAHDAVNNPIKTPKYRPDPYGGTYRYTGTDAVVNLNKEGKVVTAWARSRAGWRHE
ncbi:putative T7SS-secreted protein [Amycolatopsis sp. NPDC004368]